jgi:hypothetical protein
MTLYLTLHINDEVCAAELIENLMKLGSGTLLTAVREKKNCLEGAFLGDDFAAHADIW